MQEQQQALIPLVKYLYNTGYAEIDVSQECRDKYKELYHVDLDEDINCCRTDQNIINVIDILGLETGHYIVKSIMEKSKIKIDEETQKKLATFFDNLPDEVKENFNKMSYKQIESVVT